MVLLDGAGDALCPPATSAATRRLVDRHAFGEVLALADPDLGEPVDDQVVDLGDVTVDLDPEVMDGRPVRGAPEVQLDLVGGVPLALLPCADLAQFPFDPPRRRSDQAVPGEQLLERLDVSGRSSAPLTCTPPPAVSRRSPEYG